MYREAYKPDKIQISVVQIVMIVLILTFSLFIPAGMIADYRARQNPPMYTQEALALRAQTTTGNVAGATTAATTSSTVHIPLLNIDINMNSEAGLLVVGALLLVGVALVVTIYLLITPRKHLRKS